jgi:hypothetical protein
MRITLAIVLIVAVIAAAVLWWAQRRWDAATADMLARLRTIAVPLKVTVYSEAELVGLPAPVVRYFRTVLRHGQPIIQRARIAWVGEFNMGKQGADKWVPFTAMQEFLPSAPGMVWDARMAMAPGVSVYVRDSFVDGAGSMHGAVVGLFTVVDVRHTRDCDGGTAALLGRSGLASDGAAAESGCEMDACR